MPLQCLGGVRLTQGVIVKTLKTQNTHTQKSFNNYWSKRSTDRVLQFQGGSQVRHVVNRPKEGFQVSGFQGLGFRLGLHLLHISSLHSNHQPQLPPTSSVSLTSLPLTPWASASSNARLVAASTTAPAATCCGGMGTASSMPLDRWSLRSAQNTAAALHTGHTQPAASVPRLRCSLRLRDMNFKGSEAKELRPCTLPHTHQFKGAQACTLRLTHLSWTLNLCQHINPRPLMNRGL